MIPNINNPSPSIEFVLHFIRYFIIHEFGVVLVYNTITFLQIILHQQPGESHVEEGCFSKIVGIFSKLKIFLSFDVPCGLQLSRL